MCATPGYGAGRVRIETAEPTATLYRLTAWALEQQIELQGLTVSRASLEDIYLRLTGASLMEGEE